MTRCQAIYDDVLALHNATAERFGAVGTSFEGDRAWHQVLDAWEVAYDACVEEGNAERAEAARGLGSRVLQALKMRRAPLPDDTIPGSVPADTSSSLHAHATVAKPP